jgi:hypothetical protein
MSVPTGSALQHEQKDVNIDDRHWDDAVPRREKKAPSAVQHAYTHCRYEVGCEAAPWHGRQACAMHIECTAAPSYLRVFVIASAAASQLPKASHLCKLPP